MNERQRSEYRVAQTSRLRLYDINNGGLADRAAVILQYVGFPGGNDKADLIGAGAQHALDQILADSARALGRAIEAAADEQQLLRERQRLNASAAACGRHDTPHRISLPALRQ